MTAASRPQTDVDVLVLGAGIIGVTTAYMAQQAGYSVALVDRQDAAALETSFANGGQISVSHAEPWASPRVPAFLARHWRDPQSPFLLRPRFSLAQWRWLARFLWECLPHRFAANTDALIDLALQSHQALQAITAAETIDYGRSQRGLLRFFRSQAEFDEASHIADAMNARGYPVERLTPAQAVAAEPTLESVAPQIIGAFLAPRDESGDARAFAQALAGIIETRGATLLMGHAVTRVLLDRGGHRCIGADLQAADGARRITARHTVCALGWQSTRLLDPLGIRLNMYPLKGYSLSVPIAGANGAPKLTITDEGSKTVYSNLGSVLRVAGTAELGGTSTQLDTARLEAMRARAQATFPAAGDYAAATPWAGLRPSSATNRPWLGPTRYPGLWLNTGHGTLGWTLSAGSAQRIIAQIQRC